MSTTLLIFGIITGALTIVTAVWNISASYANLKNVKDAVKELPTRDDLNKMDSALREMLRKEFVSWIDWERIERSSRGENR